LSTDPSSSAMRARPLTCVFTRSFQFTADFGDAVMFLEPRAMLTAGMTRETSPARSVPLWGSAETTGDVIRQTDTSMARPQTCEDFVFIKGSPEWVSVSFVVTGLAQQG